MFIKKNKVIIFFMLFCLFVSAGLTQISYADDNIADIDITKSFKDPYFRDYVRQLLKKKPDEYIGLYEVSQIKVLDLWYAKNVSDLSGLEWFYGLEELYFGSSPKLTSVDLSNFPELKILQINSHNLTKLDLSKNPKLEQLECISSKLTKLDLSKNPKLKLLNCYENKLTQLDLRQNPQLKALSCSNNELTSLEFSKNSKLTSLNCARNKLASVNLQDCPQLSWIDLHSNKLTKLDLSKHSKLKKVDCSYNNLSSINLPHTSDIEEIHVHQNRLSQLNLGNASKLVRLLCNNNKLNELNVRQCPSLKYLRASNNYLSKFDTGQCPDLTYLSCSDNRLTSINVRNNTKLRELYVSNNNLSSIDVSKNPALGILSFDDNNLTELSISNNPHLKLLSCERNQLENLDVSKNPLLDYLNCSYNYLTKLDIRNNPKLYYLYIKENYLSSENEILGLQKASFYDEYKFFPQNSVPTAPQNFTATPGEGKVNLSWKYPAYGGKKPLFGYEVSHNNGDSWISIGLVNNYTFEDLEPLQAYYFKVRGISDYGEGVETKAIKAVPLKAITIPNKPDIPIGFEIFPPAPSKLTANVDDESVTLNWAMPSYEGISHISGFEVLCIKKGGGLFNITAWIPLGLESSYTFTGLSNNETYTFKVRAVNRWGKGVEAEIEASPKPTTKYYTLTFDSGGGSKINSISRAEGTYISLSDFTPDYQGYDFKGWYGDPKYHNEIFYVYLDEDTTVYADWIPVEVPELESEDFYSKANDWAKDELEQAFDAGLIPDILLGKDMTQTISREEFAELAVKLYEESTGKIIEITKPNPFTDTSNPQIMKAHQVGITYGVSADKFAPKTLISREQCATMLYRAIQGIDPKADYKTENIPDFPDQKYIADWAVEATKYMSKLGIILGNTKGEFMPKPLNDSHKTSGYGMASREAAVLMSIRTYLNIN